jgi:hypothetical protein
MAAVDVTSTPTPQLNAASFQRRSSQDESGSYDRSYVQKIHTMGQSSKESWITRLWHHMFGAKGADGNAQDSDSDGGDAPVAAKENPKKPSASNKGQVVHLPPIGNGSSQRKSRDTQRSDTHSKRSSSQPDGRNSSRSRQRVALVGSGGKVHTLPAELANSPYMPQSQKNAYSIAPTPPSRDKVHHTQSLRDSNIKREARSTEVFMKKPSHPYLSLRQDTWKPKTTRGENLVQLEKRAKTVADKAMKVSLICCILVWFPLTAFQSVQH